ncbi:MAG: MBL fold metallo-hydrolase [Chthoniobacterales bacterium]
MNIYPSSFEDNWHDVVTKAMRGLSITPLALAEKSGLAFHELQMLLDGHPNHQHLIAIAEVLSLHPQALVDLECGKHYTTSAVLPKNLKRFTTPFHGMEVHSYLLWSDENNEAIAFDTGSDCSGIVEELEKRKLTLRHVLLTHGHQDHLNDLERMLEKTGAEAWIGRPELAEKAHSISKNDSWSINTFRIIPRSTPGHSPGGTTYVIENLVPSVAIVGDALFARSVGGIPAPTYQAALKAIRENILSLPATTILCPGHGALTTVGEEWEHNPFFAEKLTSQH